SAGLDKAGPLVSWMGVPNSFGSTVANVVLPSPGGPSNRICGNGSLSFLHALRSMPSLSTMAFCPTTSRSQRGRSAASRWRSSGVWPPVTTGVRAMRGLSLLLVHFEQNVLDRGEFAARGQHFVEPVPGFHRTMADAQ